MHKDFKYRVHWFLLWIPVFIQMGLIFYFSSQPGGSPTLDKFPLPAGLGHFLGYGLLGLLLYRALNNGFTNWSIIAARNAFIIGLLYAICDEVHQFFVPGREASIFDVLIDTAGLAVAQAVLYIFNYTVLPKKRFGHKKG